jgi:hypothetical protein
MGGKLAALRSAPTGFIRERRACGTGDAAKSSSSSALKTTHGMNPRISTSVSSIKK